jgi:hypothetical protein
MQERIAHHQQRRRRWVVTGARWKNRWHWDRRCAACAGPSPWCWSIASPCGWPTCCLPRASIS